MKNKVLYLTIDDGPSSDFKEKVAFLRKKKIPAIFFNRGDLLQERPVEAAAAIRHGFAIGNHSFHHPFFSKISLKQAYREIEKGEEAVEACYRQAGRARPLKIFRFPFGDEGGDRREALQRFLRAKKFTPLFFPGVTYPWFAKYNNGQRVNVRWTFDCQEYRYAPDVVFRHLEDKKPYFGGFLDNPDSQEVILIHDHDNAKEVPLFYKIIAALVKRKFTFALPPALAKVSSR